MPNRNEASSLQALRELREMERRRLAEATEVRARAEAERRNREAARRRAEEEQRARHEAERRAAEGREAAESTRLRRDLDQARLEITKLLAELERASLGRAEGTPPPLPPPAPARSRWFGWLGLSAGASMLVGALALTAAMQPRPPRAVSVETPSATCSDSPPTAVPAPPSVAEAMPEPTVAPPPKVKPRPRPPARPPGAGKPPSSGPVCDGTDPLCGLPLGTLDDVGKKRRNGERKPPR